MHQLNPVPIVRPLVPAHVDLTNYTRWIKTSIIKHVERHRQGVFLFIEGQTRKTQDQPRFMEVRIDGPNQRPCGTKGEWEFEVEIDILVSTTLDEKDIYTLDRLLGIAAEALNKEISVFRYGPKPGGNPADSQNDSSYVGCLLLKPFPNGIRCNDFGQIEATTKVIQGTVEASYCMDI